MHIYFNKTVSLSKLMGHKGKKNRFSLNVCSFYQTKLLGSNTFVSLTATYMMLMSKFLEHGLILRRFIKKPRTLDHFMLFTVAKRGSANCCHLTDRFESQSHLRPVTADQSRTGAEPCVPRRDVTNEEKFIC